MTNSSKLNINCCPVRAITPDDYLIIFGDEALVPSAEGVSGYVWAGPPHLLPDGTVSTLGEPNDEWIQDIDNFKILLDSNSIDLNKILIFHLYSANGNLMPLFPTVNVPPNYAMPIPTSRIVSPTPRLAYDQVPAYPLPDGQTLTGQWILDKVNEKINPIIKTGRKKTRIIIFVDDSPSLRFGSVSSGVNSFIDLASASFNTELVLCNTERYFRWIVSTFSGNPICS